MRGGFLGLRPVANFDPGNCATCDWAMPRWIPARQADSLASITRTNGGVPSTSAKALSAAVARRARRLAP